MAYHRQQGVDTRIARIFNTYGPRMRPNDGRAVPTFMGQALEREPLTVFGDGSQTRSFCYVDDLIEGLFRLADSGEHEPVNLGNPDRALAAGAGAGHRRRDRLPQPDRVPGAAHRRPQGALPRHHRAIHLLDWRPVVDLRAGLRRVLDYELSTESHSMTGLNGDALEMLLGAEPGDQDQPV